MPAPSVGDVARITSEKDRVIRNLKITNCYAALAAAFRERATGANWCTFATWASRQAGSTIRAEDFVDRFTRRLEERSWVLAPIQSLSRMLLRRGLFDRETTLGRLVSVIHTPLDAFGHASAAVADGNLKVFEEIGAEFARFLATVPQDASDDSPEFHAFTAGLRSGPPPDGQDYLKEAFAHYVQQHHEADPTSRAALILLANLEIGLHEQTRLQPQIAAALDAPVMTVVDLGSRALDRLIPSSRRWPHAMHRAAVRMVGVVAQRLHREVIAVTREIVTESLMVLALPTGVLSLGQHLSAPTPAVFGGALHPALAAFVNEYDPCTPDQFNSAASDWSDLRQRMHYIVHLFRAYAEEPLLFNEPFTAQQVASFESGTVPRGDL